MRKLDHRTKFYLENQIKAAISETLIHELFSRNGWKVHRFGMEYAVPGFGRRNNVFTDKNSLAVRALPDFLMVNETEKRSEYIEVKYRSMGFDFDVVNHPFPSTYFVIVTPENILIQQVKELEKGAELVPVYLHPAFSVDEETIMGYLELVQQFISVKENLPV